MSGPKAVGQNHLLIRDDRETTASMFALHQPTSFVRHFVCLLFDLWLAQRCREGLSSAGWGPSGTFSFPDTEQQQQQMDPPEPSASHAGGDGEVLPSASDPTANESSCTNCNRLGLDLLHSSPLSVQTPSSSTAATFESPPSLQSQPGRLPSCLLSQDDGVELSFMGMVPQS
nr:unnamed protein product [Spirometra erinaceieuropaei]